MPPKVEPLATAHRMMKWLSMCPPEESATSRQRRLYIAYTLAIFFINVVAFSASVTYCLKLFSIDFDGTMFAFMCVIADFALIYFMITAIRKRHQIGDTFASLSIIYENSKFNSISLNKLQKFSMKKSQRSMTDEYEVNFQYLTQANNISEWMWTICFKYLAVILAGFVITPLLSVLYYYLIEGCFNTDHLYRPGKLMYAI